MSSPIQPRGPLPARVYWTRRLVVLAVALLLVVGVARLLGAGSDASSEASGQATTVSAEQTPDETAEESADAPASTPTSAPAPESPATQKPRKKKQPLAAPSGECVASDIAVEPVVREATAAKDVTIRLRLTTEEAEACTWEVSPETLTMKITSGPDDIWFSSECPREIPTQDVVVRSAKATAVEVVWNARRSDEDCSRYTGWALPGDYHVIAAALGGEPTDVQFSLEQAVSETITKTVTPKPKPKKSSPSDDSDSDSDSDSSGSGRGERSQHRAGDDGEGNPEG